MLFVKSSVSILICFAFSLGLLSCDRSKKFQEGFFVAEGELRSHRYPFFVIVYEENSLKAFQSYDFVLGTGKVSGIGSDEAKTSVTLFFGDATQGVASPDGEAVLMRVFVQENASDNFSGNVSRDKENLTEEYRMNPVSKEEFIKKLNEQGRFNIAITATKWKTPAKGP